MPFSASREFDTSAQAGVGPLNYDELPGLEEVYLEDSYVREIVETSEFLSFTLVLALTPDHPLHEPPARDDAHCYRVATLTFPRVRAKTWHERNERRFIDASGAVDLGNIDLFVGDPKGYYHLEGDFGVLDVASGAPDLEIHAPKSHEQEDRAGAYAAWIRGAPANGAHGHHHGHDHEH